MCLKENNYLKFLKSLNSAFIRTHLILSILFFTIPSLLTAQSLNLNDLYIIKSIKSLKQVDYYLTSKGFTNIGLVEENTPEGWDIYQFNNNQDKLKIHIGSKFHGRIELSDTDPLIIFCVKNESDFKLFQNSLQNQGFNKDEEGLLKNGKYHWTYSNEIEIKGLWMTKENDCFQIAIMY